MTPQQFQSSYSCVINKVNQATQKSTAQKHSEPQYMTAQNRNLVFSGKLRTSHVDDLIPM